MGGNRRARTAEEQTEERLARLLRPGPRHAQVDELWSVHGPPDGPVAGDHEPRPLPDPSRPEAGKPGVAEQDAVGGLIRARLGGRFERPQLTVVAVIVIIGLLLSGWAVLRARPVAIASPTPPTTGSGQQPTGRTSTPAEASPSAPDPPAGPASPVAMIAVHVLGAVRRPGVVELPTGSRVQDAVQAADGAKERADLGDLNLAQPLADGQQIFIARDGGVSEVRDPGAGGGAAAPGSATGPGASSGSEDATSVVNLNTATSQELDQLPGVGPVTAQKILTWRDRNGTFSSVEELQEIDGIGPKTFAELAPLVTV